MADINIPGISDKYKTNDLVESLMKVERIPLTREQKSLDTYKEQQSAWRDVNQKLTSLRESVKTLYSFDNPFNNKLSSSTDESAVTATANRNASYEDFKINVISPATTDRFLSGKLDKDSVVPQGTYTYKVSEKTISLNWSGGKIKDFVSAINKRANDVIKASVIGVDDGKVSLLIESLKTGKENKLQFLDAAKTYAIDTDMISPIKNGTQSFGTSESELQPPPPTTAQTEQQGMPSISLDKVKVSNGVISVTPRGGADIKLPSTDGDMTVEFDITKKTSEDITKTLNGQTAQPVLPQSGGVQFEGVSIQNKQSDPTLPEKSATPATPLQPVSTDDILYARMNDGSEKSINISDFQTDTKTGKTHIAFKTTSYPGVESIVVRNANTGTEYDISDMTEYKSDSKLGYGPNHAVSTAADASFEYDGINISRPTNDIDDVVPDVTLHIHGKSDKPATISIKPDSDSAKQALITFVGKYNQALAEINILTQNKPEIITELDYLSDDQKKSETKKLGMFMADFSLTNAKSSLQTITSGSYKYDADAQITMLSQIGISTNASGSSSGFSESRLRGYLEIDEKKLDSALQNNLDSVKKLFGYDSNGDLIIDSGIGYAMDKQLGAYVQMGGIIASKTATLDTQIKNTQVQITKLQSQLDDKETQLKEKYGQMESTLNSLQTQQDSISNFSNKNRN